MSLTSSKKLMSNAPESIEIDGRAELAVLPFSGTTRTLSLQEQLLCLFFIPSWDGKCRGKGKSGTMSRDLCPDLEH